MSGLKSTIVTAAADVVKGLLPMKGKWVARLGALQDLVFKLREKSQCEKPQDKLLIAAEAALLRHLNKLHENGSYQIPGNYPANADPENSRNTH